MSVRILGPYSISVDGEEVATGWRDKARELLAFFLLHPEGATIDAAVEALWPEAAPGRGSEWFWTNLSNVRTQLRSATGRQELKVLTKAGDRYGVEADLFDVDLWRFQAALGAVEAAGEDRAALRAALEDAASAYGGDLLSGSGYDWPEGEREDLHRRALNTLARLTTVRLDAEDDEGALAALQRALDLDPHAEALYRQAMAIEADLGRPDVARRTFRRLEARLAELDLEPDERTKALLDRIVRHPADPPLRAGTGPAATG